MSTEAANALVARLKDDEQLRTTLESSGGPDQMIAAACAAGFDVTADDMKELNQGSQKGVFGTLGGGLGDLLDSFI